MEAIANIVPGETTNFSSCIICHRGGLRDTVDTAIPNRNILEIKRRFGRLVPSQKMASV